MGSAGELSEGDSISYSNFQALINSAQGFIWKLQFVRGRRGGGKPVKSLWKRAKGSFFSFKAFLCAPHWSEAGLPHCTGWDESSPVLSSRSKRWFEGGISEQGNYQQVQPGRGFTAPFAATGEGFPQHFLITLFFTSQWLCCDLSSVGITFGGAFLCNWLWQITESRGAGQRELCWQQGLWWEGEATRKLFFLFVEKSLWPDKWTLLSLEWSEKDYLSW